MIPALLYHPDMCVLQLLLLLLSFFVTCKPRVELYIKSMSLKYEPASKPLHIYVILLFSHNSYSALQFLYVF